MTVHIDINPWGIVEDIHVRPDQAGYEKLLESYEANGSRLECVEEGEDVILLRIGRDYFRLKIRKTIGGNQWNVAENLRFMQEVLGFNEQGLDVVAHRAEPRITRKNLYIPGLKEKIKLCESGCEGVSIFSKDLVGSSVMISSAPPDNDTWNYWQQLRDYVAVNPEIRFYWNPGSRQIAGSLTRETLTALEGRVLVRQMNLAENRDFHNYYDRIVRPPSADWIVTTCDKDGLIITTSSGETLSQPITSAPKIFKQFLGIWYVDKVTKETTVGGGDAALAALIAAREVKPDVSPRHAALFASAISSMQCHHKGPNLGMLIPEKVAHVQSELLHPSQPTM